MAAENNHIIQSITYEQQPGIKIHSLKLTYNSYDPEMYDWDEGYITLFVGDIKIITRTHICSKEVPEYYIHYCEIDPILTPPENGEDHLDSFGYTAIYPYAHHLGYTETAYYQNPNVKEISKFYQKISVPFIDEDHKHFYLKIDSHLYSMTYIIKPDGTKLVTDKNIRKIEIKNYPMGCICTNYMKVYRKGDMVMFMEGVTSKTGSPIFQYILGNIDTQDFTYISEVYMDPHNLIHLSEMIVDDRRYQYFVEKQPHKCMFHAVGIYQGIYMNGKCEYEEDYHIRYNPLQGKIKIGNTIVNLYDKEKGFHSIL